MPEAAKPKRKRQAESEKINLDDWGNAGALDGLLSFLNIKPEDAPVHQGGSKVVESIENRISDRAPDTDTPPITGPDPEALKRAASVLDRVTDTYTVAISGPDLVVVEQAAPVLDTEDVIDTAVAHPKQAMGFGNKKIYRCRDVQDGHSHTEDALYRLLWESGKPEGEDSRVVVMGYGEMSKRIRLSFNNTKAACHRLIAKQAMEEIAREISDLRQGKTYRVFSEREVMERRRRQGMEWVIRSKGVEFITPISGAGSITGMG